MPHTNDSIKDIHGTWYLYLTCKCPRRVVALVAPRFRIRRTFSIQQIVSRSLHTDLSHTKSLFICQLCSLRIRKRWFHHFTYSSHSQLRCILEFKSQHIHELLYRWVTSPFMLSSRFRPGWSQCILLPIESLWCSHNLKSCEFEFNWWQTIRFQFKQRTTRFPFPLCCRVRIKFINNHTSSNSSSSSSLSTWSHLCPLKQCATTINRWYRSHYVQCTTGKSLHPRCIRSIRNRHCRFV